MTERIYYTDSYRRDFDARVVDRADEDRRIYLDRTAFYPTSGGQPHDRGALAGIAVVDVVDEGERIAHLLERPLTADSAAQSVRGSIDWARRFDHMQQHTGQHLLSAVFEDLYGYHTLSVHFSPESSTLDLDTESLSHEAIARAERRANEVVTENRPVSASFEDATTAAGLRKASDREGLLRIISIQEVDRSACGGTHVATTGEIGAIVLRRVERIRKSTRIEFLCGARAIARARADYEALSTIATNLSASIDDVPTLVARQIEHAREADQGRRRLERELATFRARAMYDAADAGANGIRVIALLGASGDMDDLRVLAHAAIELPRAVLVASLADQPSVLVAASADSGFDAGAHLKQTLAKVGGRGGGSPRIAQGSAPAERLAEVHRALGEAVISHPVAT